MKRSLLAVCLGFIAWVLVASVLNRGLRVAIDGYAAAEQVMSFTLGVMWARLLVAAITSVIAGAVVGWVAPTSTRAPVVLGAIILALFVPGHVWLWKHFPVWYHLTFLLTLIPLVVLGASLARGRVAPPASGAVRT